MNPERSIGNKYGIDLPNSIPVIPSWRLRDRMKTAGIGLIMALNVGTDPPDIIKPYPCAKLQCWMDPLSVSRAKAKEKIGDRLEKQYSKFLQQSQRGGTLDPTVEDVRGLCLWLRKQARTERILLHYNGHGVPRPTPNGEIWVFDKNHTEYIPLSVSDLRQWVGKPTIVILDCSSADDDDPIITNMDTAASYWVKDTIVLCPTSEGEWLPMNPEYPADIFTSCLTTPIPIALRWFIRQNSISMSNLQIDPDFNVDSIPGQPNDRKTPLGELNWIFTSVTDSIAWNVLPKPLFQRLFRQDLLVASMFRNFLLADRILRSLNCTPQSYPPLPEGVADHPLWLAWDLACETCLFNLIQDGILGDNKDVSSPFFSEQLTAFEVWLEYAAIHKGNANHLQPPEQLPVVLQVLLSQVHRVRALELLKRFLELGPWAVNLALSLGIFPYVIKLLQSAEYKTVLVNIWSSILKFDPSCQVDLVKDKSLVHFIQPLTQWAKQSGGGGGSSNNTNIVEAAKQRTLIAFCLAATCHKYPNAQSECLRQNLHGSCAELASNDASRFQLLSPIAREWICMCIGNLVRSFHLGQTQAYNTNVHLCLIALQQDDDNANVRAAATYALSNLLRRGFSPSFSGQQPQQQPRRRPTVYEDRRRIEFDLKVIESMIKVLADGSPMVRYEVIMGLSNFVEKYLQAILVVAEDATRVVDVIERLGNIQEEQHGDDNYNNESNTAHSIESRKRVVSLPRGVNQMNMERFEKCWKALRAIQHDDPHPNVSEAANVIVRVVHETFYDMRMEEEAKIRDMTKSDHGLSGIQEEGEVGGGGEGIDRVKSVSNISMGSPDFKRNVNIFSPKTMPRSDGPSHRLPKTNLYPLRRSSSEAGGGNFPSSNVGDETRNIPAMPDRNLIDRVKAENLLPKSEFYKWKKSIFRPDYDDVDLEDRDDRDPLNPLGAARNYQNRRNKIVRREGLNIAHHFQILRNAGGVKMTSMLKFHSYENALVVCDNEDFVSIWDYENGVRKSSFKNGNPTGSRMTTAFWINESSTSLLFVGCDDGSARIWNGIVENNGQISGQAPTLASSFFAIPDMEPGQRSSSGLICEWQQTTGTLISGGNSRHLRCWDMTAEKCSTSIDIDTNSCITALTTAWDEDEAYSAVHNSNGFRGTGPEIIVAGLSDGTLKLFDIRTPKTGATFNEHGSWIVDVSFSSFGSSGGSQNEILSGSVAGDIRAWDIRSSSRSSLRAIEVQRSPMTALSVHKKIPIAATGSHAQFIKILTLEGETLQVARFHENSLPGHRIGPVSCLEFHKHKLVLAAGSTNALVSIYQPRRP
ncbi:WD40 repeat-like protein [Fragilariopsis cylindrus CCMP1102]|uniref:WD40 repeat-like protein n=1 Tax=Fragilariopsis cylindrus CCMP1102 TaxID=635003 RepID=A0A1E7EQB5_9STRA|nr:WD40 repeat-like protein [Fragilariopsis cylindrus CCMP1102]|eukprot:OEU07733.1 WD40 repeat-like protein [Fragilariopsis cylindrus CCMP1102]